MSSQPLLPSGGTATSRLQISSIYRQAEGVLSLDSASVDGSSLPGGLPERTSRSSSGREWFDTIRCAAAPMTIRAGASPCCVNELAGADRSRSTSKSRPAMSSPSEGPATTSLWWIRSGISSLPGESASRLSCPWFTMSPNAVNRGRSSMVAGRSQSMAFVEELGEGRGGDLHVMPEDEYGLLDLDHFLGTPVVTPPFTAAGPVH